MPKLWVFETECFHCPQRIVSYIRRQKSFSYDYFDDLLHRNTRGYEGLQELATRYMGLQGVIKGYKGL